MKERSDHNTETINFILEIVKTGVENRGGGLVKDAESLVDILMKIIHPTSLHQNSSIDLVAEILALLLMLDQVTISQELASKIVVSVSFTIFVFLRSVF